MDTGRDDARGTGARPLPGVLKRTTIDAAWLEERHACRGDVELFRAAFGHGPVEITAEVFDRAVGAGLCLDWAAAHLLTTTAWRAYWDARATAWLAYWETIATGRWRAYEEATPPVLRVIVFGGS